MEICENMSKKDKRKVLSDLANKGVILNLNKVDRYEFKTSAFAPWGQYRPSYLKITIGNKEYDLPEDLEEFVLNQIKEMDENKKVMVG